MRHHVISIFLILLIFTSIGSSFAQLKDDALLWTLNLGYGKVKNVTLDENIPNWSFNTTLEHLLKNSDISIGFNLGWSSTNEVLSISSVSKSWETYSTKMLLFTGKYHFNRSNDWVPYLGLGLGIHNSTVDFAFSGTMPTEPIDTIIGSRSRGGVAAAASVGINVYSSETLFAGANFTPVWMENSYYKDNWFWMVNFGLGFQFN
jgi:hypothetical protein